MSSLGRKTKAAQKQAAAVLAVLDEVTQPRVVEASFDEIFVGRQPILMGVEPNSFCWIVGDLAENRTGETWSARFARFPRLEHAVSDAGTGLLKGLALANARRGEAQQPPIAHALDVFHTQREGGRALRRTEAQVWKAQQRADDGGRRLEQRRRQGKSLQGQTQQVHAAAAQAERLLDEAIQIEAAWSEVCSALEWFTPDGPRNTAPAARAKLERWLPHLQGPHWAKTVRLLQREESLAFLERLETQLAKLPFERSVVEDAVRLEGLRRNPRLLQAEDGGGLRAWHMLANLRLARDASFAAAVEQVRGLFRRCWRASSLVEGINSVLRMQQARHRRLTAGLLDLKRLYWNCRRFRAGRRKNASPYELLGIQLPGDDWWELLKQSPDELRQQLSGR